MDAQDSLHPPRAAILGRIAARRSSGAIILMHLDTTTADALPSVADLLHRRGCAIVSLPSLLADGGRVAA